MIYANSIIESNEKSTGLPDQYKEYQDVFEKKNADMLPQHRLYDCGIDLQEGTQPPFGPIYSLLQNELTTLREYLDGNLAKNFIRHLKSLVGAPILFVKKKDGSLRMCVDYRGLNKITVKIDIHYYLFQDFLISSVKQSSTLKSTFEELIIWFEAGNEWKTAFRTRYGHFEYNVMHFGLTNALAIFQHLMMFTVNSFIIS